MEMMSGCSSPMSALDAASGSNFGHSRLEGLPAEILFEIHIYLHQPLLPLISKTLHAKLRPSNTSIRYKARYILSRWFCNWYAGGLDLQRKVYAIQERDQPHDGVGGAADPPSSSSASFPPLPPDPLIIPQIGLLDRNEWHKGPRSKYFLQRKELAMQTTDGENRMTMWRKLSENYTHPLSLSMPRPINAASDQNPIGYALLFLLGRAGAPQDLLCTAEVLHLIEHWVLNCQALEEVARANGLTAVRKPSDPSKDSPGGVSLEGLCNDLDKQKKSREYVPIKHAKDPASQLRAAVLSVAMRKGPGASEARHLTVFQLRLSSLPVQLIRRAALEVTSGFLEPEQEAGSENSSEPYKFVELANRLSQLGEGPMPSRPTLHLLLTVRFRYTGSLFNGPLFLTDPYYEQDLAEIGKHICRRQMLWMVPLFLPHWFPFSHDHSVKSTMLLRQAILSKSLPAFRAFYEDRRQGASRKYDKYNVATLEQLAVIVDLAKRYGVPWSHPAYSDSVTASHDQALRSSYDALIRNAPLPTQMWDIQKLHTRRALFLPEGSLHEEALGVRAALRKLDSVLNKWPLPHAPGSLPRRFNDSQGRNSISADVSSFARVVNLNDLAWHLPMTILDAYRNQSCVLPFTDSQYFDMPIDLTTYGPSRAENRSLLSLAVQKQVYDIAAYLVDQGVAPDLDAMQYLEGNVAI